MNDIKFDISNRNQQIIIGALASMVEDEGLTTHEAFEVLEDIKRNTWHALSDIGKERDKQ